MPNVSARITRRPACSMWFRFCNSFFALGLIFDVVTTTYVPTENITLESRDLLQFVLVGVVEEMKP